MYILCVNFWFLLLHSSDDNNAVNHATIPFSRFLFKFFTSCEKIKFSPFSTVSYKWVQPLVISQLFNFFSYARYFFFEQNFINLTNFFFLCFTSDQSLWTTYSLCLFQFNDLSKCICKLLSSISLINFISCSKWVSPGKIGFHENSLFVGRNSLFTYFDVRV